MTIRELIYIIKHIKDKREEKLIMKTNIAEARTLEAVHTHTHTHTHTCSFRGYLVYNKIGTHMLICYFWHISFMCSYFACINEEKENWHTLFIYLCL